MPIHTCSGIPLGIDALWTYIPNEEIDFTRYWYIRHLRIECYDPADGPQMNSPAFNHHTVYNCDIEYDQTYTKCQGRCFYQQPPQSSVICCSSTSSSSVSTSTTVEETTNTTSLPAQQPYQQREGYPAYPPPPTPTVTHQPYTIPSLKYLFPRLKTLIIKNIPSGVNCGPTFIGSLTSIPSTVVSLEIEHTLINNIGEIVMDSPNLVFLQIRNNQLPIKNLTQLPPNLTRFSTFRETLTTPIKANTHLEFVYMVQSKFPGITDLNPEFVKDIMIRWGKHPYDRRLLDQSDPRDIIKHINLVHAHQVYIHYASIPLRIRRPNAEDEYEENPIIVALHLASNYPRRMAEFMSYVS